MSGAIHLHGPRPYLLRLLAQYPFSNEQSNSFRVMTHLSLAGVVLSGLGCHGRFISTYKKKCSENYSSLKLINERLSKLFSFHEYLKYLNGFFFLQKDVLINVGTIKINLWTYICFPVLWRHTILHVIVAQGKYYCIIHSFTFYTGVINIFEIIQSTYANIGIFI